MRRTTWPARAAVYLNRGGNFYALGTRAFFYCVPLVFWLLGPVLFVVATGVLLAALYPLDRASRMKPPVLDDLVVLVTALKTLEVSGLTARYARWSNAFGGVSLLAIGALLIFRPEWLTFG